jgi:hypothetical protein
MKKLSLLTAFIFTFAITIVSQESSKIIGNWSGSIELPAAKLEVIFKISVDSTNNFTARMDVPAQGAKDLPVSQTAVTRDSLKLVVAMIFGIFEGEFINDITARGNWNQGGASFPLTLTKSEKVTELKRPQTPKPPFPYLSEDVEYVNSKSGLKLTGTLTLPENAKDCPSVILISGSGAQDRDETIFGHKPFWVIADYLTRNGIAVLRVDDRGVGGSEGNSNEATSEDFAVDVIAGIEYLKKRNDIDHSKIGLIGHSEGGLIAPLVAVRTTDVAFIVLLAGPGTDGERLLYQQNDLTLKAAGMDENSISQIRKIQEAIFDILKNEKDSAKQLDRLQRTFSGGVYPMMDDEQKKIIDARVNAINNTWFKFFLTYDPYPVLTKIKCPVLAINGDKDVQVPADQNLESIQKALTEGRNENIKTMKLKNLNHLFQHCETGAVSEYGEIEETISPEVLEIIKDWIWETVE